MTDAANVDHLFRHQYGKMVAVLSQFFGLQHLEMIEDAVQDTFIKASQQWRMQQPVNPEAWLTQAAKRRMIDLLRQVRAESLRVERVSQGAVAMNMGDIFLDHEVADSQLRMIFVACHPALSGAEQIAFALKTISGFSMKEIAAALLVKDETIKKRLIRARKTIIDQRIEFEYPDASEVNQRIEAVLRVIYLIFTEGFHSTKGDELIRQDLCGEALRLIQLLLKNPRFRTGSAYALLALICFHGARLESKIGANGEIIDLEHQDRSTWHWPLIKLGNEALNEAVEYDGCGRYHFEAAIAGEHIRAKTFAETNWAAICNYYIRLMELDPTPSTRLNLATVYMQLNEIDHARQMLESVCTADLNQRAYLLHGAWAALYHRLGEIDLAISAIEQAIDACTNDAEREYLQKKRLLYLN